jgi:hypothetical protein
MQAKMAQCKPIQPNINQNSGFGSGGLSDGGCVLGGGGSELGSISGALNSGCCCGLVVVILLTVVLMVMVSMAVVSVMVVLVVMIVGWGYIFLPSWMRHNADTGKHGRFGGIWAHFAAVFGCFGFMGVRDSPQILRLGV